MCLFTYSLLLAGALTSSLDLRSTSVMSAPTATSILTAYNMVSRYLLSSVHAYLL